MKIKHISVNMRRVNSLPNSIEHVQELSVFFYNELDRDAFYDTVPKEAQVHNNTIYEICGNNHSYYSQVSISGAQSQDELKRMQSFYNAIKAIQSWKYYTL